jgi:general stress protein 26
MKRFVKVNFLLCLILLLPSMSFSQNEEDEDSSKTKLTQAAREIMSAAGTCALITLDENDLPMVRTMDPFLPDDDFTVWFGTNARSRKVKQIKNNPNVTLYYLDNDTSGYVVLHGTAKIVDDQQEKEKRWKTEWEAFYPNKTEDYLLIKVSPISMEVLSYSRGIFGDPATWEAPVLFFDAK